MRYCSYYLLIAIGATVFVGDQFSKILLLHWLDGRSHITVIPGVFDIVHVQNRGAAFGFLNRADIDWQIWLFGIATGIAILAIFMLARRASCLGLIGLGCILGGACGNLLDRIRLHAVTDFLDFYWGNWHWPAFNLADTAICIGVGLTVLADVQKQKSSQ